MRRNILLPVLMGCLVFLSLSFSPVPNSVGEIPDEVSKVLTSSCYGCHSSDAKNKDAREALNFEEWENYRPTKKIGLLGDICKLVKENKMPPERFLTNNPDKKLTEEQGKLICDWTEKEAAKLMGGE